MYIHKHKHILRYKILINRKIWTLILKLRSSLANF